MNAVASLRARVPEPAREAGRLAAARRLERRVRASGAARGAAFVMHATGPAQGDRELEIDPALAVAHLDAIAGYLHGRYELVRAGELLAAVAARRPGDAVPLALTFDDDLTSHAEHAAPVLARHGAVATAFLTGAREPFWWLALQAALDGRAIRPAELPELAPELVRDALERRPGAAPRLAEAIERLSADVRAQVAGRLLAAAPHTPPLLTAEQAGALAAAGWEIGFHTRGHDLLPALADEALEHALRDGRDALPGGRPLTLAYPHGKAGPREAAAARECGYRAAFTGASTVVTEATDPHMIGRLQPDVTTVGRTALQLARALADA